MIFIEIPNEISDFDDRQSGVSRAIPTLASNDLRKNSLFRGEMKTDPRLIWISSKAELDASLQEDAQSVRLRHCLHKKAKEFNQGPTPETH